jgi:hypothetical protein
MMIDAVMADARTTFRFATRGAYLAAITRQPKDLDNKVTCWASYRDEPGRWVPRKLLYLRSHSIASVVAVPVVERDKFLAEHDPATWSGSGSRRRRRVARNPRSRAARAHRRRLRAERIARRRAQPRTAARPGEELAPLLAFRVTMHFEVAERFRRQGRELLQDALRAHIPGLQFEVALTDIGLDLALELVADSDTRARERAIYQVRRAVEKQRSMSWRLPRRDVEVQRV